MNQLGCVLIPFIGRARLAPAPTPLSEFHDATSDFMLAFLELAAEDRAAAAQAIGEIVKAMVAGINGEASGA